MKKYEITTYHGRDNYNREIFAFTFRNVVTDNYIYTNGVFDNVLLFAQAFACGRGVRLDDICTIR